jgi:AraC-like DNA-binding protein
MANFIHPQGMPNFLETWRLPNSGMTFHLTGIRLRRVNANGWSYPMHEHMQYEISMLMEGDQIVVMDGKSYRQHAGDLLIIKPGVRHSSRQGESSEFTHFYLHFDTDDNLLNLMLQSCREPLFHAGSETAARVRPVLERLAGWAKRGQPLTFSERMLLNSELFQFFAGLGESLAVNPEALVQPDLRNTQLSYEIADKIKAMAAKSIMMGTQESISDIVKSTGISSSHCNRIFRQTFGMSPRRYLSNLKLHEAVRLLKTDLQITQIAGLLGYRDIAHFSLQFKRWTGLSPVDYRRIHLPEAASAVTPNGVEAAQSPDIP